MTAGNNGWLVCVGTGIRAVGQVTIEARNHIVAADKVYYVCTDPVSAEWVRRLNPTAESLKTFYGDGKRRLDTYRQMTDTLVRGVRAGMKICAAIYGHPGVFATPTHDAIRILRAEGYRASMQPGVSAEDCLYADLGIDPARHGCQMYEASILLASGRSPEPTAAAIIWQIGFVGEGDFNIAGFTGQNIPALVDHLERTYGPDHVVTVYEAAIFPTQHPRMDTMPLREVRNAQLSGISTLYLPPISTAADDPTMVRRLRLDAAPSNGLTRSHPDPQPAPETPVSPMERTTVMPADKRGSLVCVGTGIKAISQFTMEARTHIVVADKVYYLCTDALSEEWIRRLNPTAESLYTLYGDGKQRLDTYRQMTDALVQGVRAGRRVCAVFYGHPGVFVAPTHEAIRVLRAEGYQASMQPGISAEDCLYADLGIDPAVHGCQMYEATNLLRTGRMLAPAVAAIIWQIGSVGESDFNLSGFTQEHLPALVEHLERSYGPEHEVTVYEAAIFAAQKARIDVMPLHELRNARLNGISTLYIPPRLASGLGRQLDRESNSTTRSVAATG